MKITSNDIHSLTDELMFFKQITFNEDDPIKRYAFTIKEINYIMKRIYKFQVPSTQFFKIYNSKNKDDLMNLLCECYLKLNIVVGKEYDFIKKFISIFYDYNNPVYKEESNNFLWIYPKVIIKNFIKESIFENKDQNVYFDKNTLDKLVNIFANFTKFEYSNCDNMSFLFEGLNYPSLVLANIDLYEKGYIKVVEDLDEIKIFLNKKDKIKSKPLFTENRHILKNHILRFINSSEERKYSLNDFI